MKLPTAAVLVACLLLPASPLRADPFTIQPNGQLVFTTGLTTSASFTCRQGLACQGAGTNSITFGTGENTTTFAFTGVDTSVAITNSAARVSLGQISFTTTGSGFSFPETLNPNVGIFDFGLRLSHTEPTATSRGRSWRFHAVTNRNVELFMGNPIISFFGIGEQPPGYNYSGVVYTVAFPIRLRPGATEISAEVGLVPEPTTLALVGSGLGLALMRRRRRQTEQA